MKMLLVLAIFALGLSGPASAMAGVDQDGNRVEIDDGQEIASGREIVIRIEGEQRTLIVEGITRNDRGIAIDATDEDGTPFTFRMAIDQPGTDEPDDEM
jgi:hypothetical protein